MKTNLLPSKAARFSTGAMLLSLLSAAMMAFPVQSMLQLLLAAESQFQEFSIRMSAFMAQPIP